jgi:hypothetical protein
LLDTLSAEPEGHIEKASVLVTDVKEKRGEMSFCSCGADVYREGLVWMAEILSSLTTGKDAPQRGL